MLEVKDLTKIYNGKRVLDGVNLSVKEGEIFGLLGPNGAGKTTLLNIILGIKKANSGEVNILGYNSAVNPQPLKERIGVQLETSTLPGLMNVNEALGLFHSFFSEPLSLKKVIEIFSLDDYLNYRIGTLSRGWKQRLEISLALIGNPDIIFLDEPTSGLDPHIKSELWDIFMDLRNENKTLVLCTHYIEEAEKICDRVGIIDRGKIVAMDSPSKLIEDFGFKEKVTIYKIHDSKKLLANTKLKKVQLIGNNAHIYTNNSKEVIQELENIDADYTEFKVSKINLNDVFLRLTGKEIKR
jgi:ABC-2 type transport system ATP-binding protein